MTSIVTRGFGGLIPQVAPQLLPLNAATGAVNLKTFGKSLSSWRKGTNLTTPGVTGITTIYRMYSGSTDYWLAWATDANVIRVPGSSDFRLFYTGDPTPRKTNLSMATSGTPYPKTYYEMGIPAPTALTAAVGAAGAGTAATRNYVCTYVNDFGEEGPPSPASNSVTFNATGFTINLSALEQGKKTVTITRVSTTATATCAAHGFYTGSSVTIAGAVQTEYNGTFTITVVDANTFTYTVSGAPATPATGTITASGNYGLTAMRIYRSITGSSGLVNYQLVKQVTLASSTDTDVVLDSALGAICPSFTMDGTTAVVGSDWTMPPVTTNRILLHPGNFAVALAGNLLIFSEPSQFHAYPVRYQIKLDHDGVALGIVGSTVVVATKGKAYVVTGNHPLNMTKEDAPGFTEPCTSGRGIVKFPFGVLYPTPNGMQLVGIGGSANALNGFVKRDQWQANYFPNTIFATIFQGAYFGFYNNGSRVKGFVLDKDNDAGPLTDLDYNITAIYADEETATLYYVLSDVIYTWEADTINLSPYDWTGKQHVLPRDCNLAFAQIDADWNAFNSAGVQQAAQILLDQAYNAAILAVDALANIPVRADTTAYTVGQTVQLSGQQLVCTVAGTTAGAPPSLAGKVLNDTVADNTVTWKLIWQVQSIERGCVNENEYNEFIVDGSLLRDPTSATYDTRYIQLQIYAYNPATNTIELKVTKNVMDGDAFALPAGYSSHVYQKRISGNIDVYACKVAESVRELMAL